ncbi:MAG: carbon monoxide dehydrogenase subunit G [Rhodospirillaceae bacterium]|nr:carbon monoxide dehydrogenase subunit G [Rhodospirillaceae bacterium]
MELKGSFDLAAPKQQVWDALNDPEVLKGCIPGCEEIDKTSDTSFSAKVTAKVGPVKAKFTGDVTLSDLDPPNAYKISGEGKGGAAGFAKGGANVSLKDNDSGGTTLEYAVTAQVGGKLAQIGSRLIDSTAKKMAREFFETFGKMVDKDQNGDNNNLMSSIGEKEMSNEKNSEENVYPNTHWTIWLIGAISVAALIVFISNL